MAALEHAGKYRKISYTVTLNVQPAMRFRWIFTTATGLTESGISAFGMHAALEAGRRAAEDAIDLALDGK